MKGGEKMSTTIKVSTIENNPHRDMARLPLDNDKVERLMISIKDTEFWDNVVVRPHPNGNGNYQLAYGHHRLEALRRLKVHSVNIPVKDLDDDTMLRMMARENYEWGQSPNLVLETVRQVRIHLDKALAKYDSWENLQEEIMTSKNRRHIVNVFSYFQNAKSFSNAKRSGVGRETILKYLGEGYKKHHINSAISILDSEIKAEEEAARLKEEEAQRRVQSGLIRCHDLVYLSETTILRRDGITI
jgi:hypothetical protein